MFLIKRIYEKKSVEGLSLDTALMYLIGSISRLKKINYNSLKLFYILNKDAYGHTTLDWQLIG